MSAGAKGIYQGIMDLAILVVELMLLLAIAA